MNPIFSPRRRAFAALPALFTLWTLASVGVFTPDGLRADPVEADTTEAFIDSMGVNVHWAYPIYYNNYAALKARLGELGIRHVRDGAVTSSGQVQVYAKSMDLYNTYGIRTTFITGRRLPGAWPKPLDPSKISTELNEIKTEALAAAAAIEGPNEYDISSPSDGSEPDWIGKLRAYQQAVYTQVRADANADMQGLPIVGPSLTSAAAYASVGNLDPWLNFPCIHHYQTDRHPGIGGWGNNGYGSITWAYNYLVNAQSPSGKPVQSTECGYHQSLAENGLSLTADGKYTPRMFAEFYRRGYYRSFKYELMNMGTSGWEQLHGLLDHTGQPKPAFHALKNLITLLKEPGADFVPGALDFTMSGSTSNVRQVLLQKSNGQFFLLIWKEVSSWDPVTNQDISVAASNVTLAFNQPVAQVAVYKPSVSTAVQGTPWANPASVNLSVPDELLVVRIIPRPENLAPAGTISAYSSQSSSNPASLAIDGIDHTDDNRWSAVSWAYPQWIEVDLGSNKRIDATEVVSMAGRAYRFRVEAKPAGGTYQTIVNRTASTQPSPIADSFSPVTARYVKLTVTGAYNYTGDWVAIREFKILNSSRPVAMDIIAVTASTSQTGNGPAKAIDASLYTRWSANGNNQWIRFDLGAAKTITEARLAFEEGNQRQYYFSLQSSLDGSNWTTILPGQSSSGATTLPERFPVGAVNARYLRYLGVGNSLNSWNHVNDAQVFGY